MQEMIPTQPTKNNHYHIQQKQGFVRFLLFLLFTVVNLNSARSPLSSTVASTIANMVTGNHSSPFRYDYPAQTEASQTESSKSDHDQCLSLCSESFLYDQIEFVINQIAYFDKILDIMGKGSLCKHITFVEKSISVLIRDLYREVCSKII